MESYTEEYICGLSENELRTQIVIPLFRAMRFAVYENHGALEVGKDLILYDRDNTGEIIYSAVQIKTKNIHGTISRRGNIRDIIQQCELAFQIPFVDAFGPTQRHVEKVYVVTSGKITKSAENIIANSLKSHGPVKFMGIERLVAQASKLLSTGSKHIAKSGTLPSTTPSTTRLILTGCGELYVTYSVDGDTGSLVFAHLAKAGGCASAQLEALGSLISLALDKGASVRDIIVRLRGIRCPSIAWESGRSVLSCADAIAGVLEEHITEGDRDIDAELPESIQL